MQSITPLGEFILVKPVKEATSTAGLEAPEILSKNKATVIALPNPAPIISTDPNAKAVDLHPELKVDSIVYIADYMEHPVKKDGEEYFFVKLEDVMGVEQ